MLVNKVYCPTCKSHNSGSTDVSGEGGKPSDGDISMCLYCGTISKYVITETTISLGEFTETEMAEVMRDPDVIKAIMVGRLISQRRRG